MKNIFLSFRFTGEDPKKLEHILGNMKQSLETAGHKVVCSLFLENYFTEKKFTNDQIYEYMLEQQRYCHIFMPLIKTHEKSKGMKLESDLALELRQRYVLAHKEGVYLPEFHDNAHEYISFSNYPELFGKLLYFR